MSSPPIGRTAARAGWPGCGTHRPQPSRITKAGPPEAEALNERLYGMLPHVRITDLIAEVDGWTDFTDGFTHLRTGDTVDDRRLIMTGILADGLNLGLTRMAEACPGISLGRLAWAADWHLREETFARALGCLVGHQHRQPLAAHFGTGLVSTSDGQFFQATGLGRDAGTINDQALHPRLRPVRSLPYQSDLRHRQRGHPCAGRPAAPGWRR